MKKIAALLAALVLVGTASAQRSIDEIYKGYKSYEKVEKLAADAPTHHYGPISEKLTITALDGENRPVVKWGDKEFVISQWPKQLRKGDTIPADVIWCKQEPIGAKRPILTPTVLQLTNQLKGEEKEKQEKVLGLKSKK